MFWKKSTRPRESTEQSNLNDRERVAIAITTMNASKGTVPILRKDQSGVYAAARSSEEERSLDEAVLLRLGYVLLEVAQNAVHATVKYV